MWKWDVAHDVGNEQPHCGTQKAQKIIKKIILWFSAADHDVAMKQL